MSISVPSSCPFWGASRLPPLPARVLVARYPNPDARVAATDLMPVERPPVVQIQRPSPGVPLVIDGQAVPGGDSTGLHLKAPLPARPRYAVTVVAVSLCNLV